MGEGGFVKVVAEADGGPVLGVHMIGPHVTDLVAEAMLITNWEAVPAEVAALIHPHPTLSEADRRGAPGLGRQAAAFRVRSRTWSTDVSRQSPGQDRCPTTA